MSLSSLPSAKGPALSVSKSPSLYTILTWIWKGAHWTEAFSFTWILFNCTHFHRFSHQFKFSSRIIHFKHIHCVNNEFPYQVTDLYSSLPSVPLWTSYYNNREAFQWSFPTNIQCKQKILLMIRNKFKLANDLNPNSTTGMSHLWYINGGRENSVTDWTGYSGY